MDTISGELTLVFSTEEKFNSCLESVGSNPALTLTYSDLASKTLTVSVSMET